MTEGVEASGKTVEEAIDAALERLGATEDEVEIKILSEGGARGLLGRRVEPARVRVRLRDERSPEDRMLEEEEFALAEGDGDLGGPPSAELEAQAEAAEEFLRGLLEALGLEGEVAATAGARSVTVEINGPEMGLLIGRHGATLDAVQELVRSAVQRRTTARARVEVDIEGYRARQRSTLERRARDAAAKARRSRRAVTLEPMTAYARKVVHDALAQFTDIETTSEGDEPNRRVAIRAKGGGGRPGPGGGRPGQRPRRPGRGRPARGGN